MAHRGAEVGMLGTSTARRLIVFGALLLITALSVPAGPAARAAEAPPAGRTVIIGVPGLMWSDVTERNTPALWRLTGQGGAAGLSVRTTIPYTCPMDGWLTVSAGQRSRLAHGDCALPSTPQALPGGGAAAPGWDSIKKDNAGSEYKAQVGLLGDAVKGAGGCTFAVGPGAVFGLADGTGQVTRYAESPDKTTAADWSRCPLSAVDVDDLFGAYLAAGVDIEGDQVPLPDDKRAVAAAAADRRVAQVTAALPAGTTMLLAGLSDTSGKPHLRVSIATGTAFPAGFMSSTATRQPGMVTLTDLTATTLRSLGLPQPKAAVGSPWESSASKATTTHKVDALVDENVAAQAIRKVQGSFFWVLGATQITVYLIALLLMRRHRGDPVMRRRVLGGARVVALMAGAAPVASFLAGLVPWWQAPRPTPVLITAVAAFSALVAALALAGPWRRSVIAPGLVVTGVTLVVLAADVMAGSTLQLNSLMGYTALMAGRFYGFGNQAYSLFAVAAVLSAAWLAQYPLREGRTGRAVAVVAAVGVVAVAIDGLPAWGSDFGGVLAMVPVFAMLGLMVAGRRVSPVKLGLFGLAGAALVLFISFLNARSSSPTHLGRFWQDLMAGEAWAVVVRKFQAMVGALGLWPITIVLAVAVIALYLVLTDPGRWHAAPLLRLYRAAPTMRAALVCALAVGVLGTLANDSGIVIMSVTITLAGPLALAALLRALELPDVPAETTGPDTPAPRSAAQGR